jgi:hypothetical protein
MARHEKPAIFGEARQQYAFKIPGRRLPAC